MMEVKDIFGVSLLAFADELLCIDLVSNFQFCGIDRSDQIGHES